MVGRTSKPESRKVRRTHRAPAFRRSGKRDTKASGVRGRVQAVTGRLRQAADRLRKRALRGRGDRRR